jgi:hypothetical protein
VGCPSTPGRGLNLLLLNHALAQTGRQDAAVTAGNWREQDIALLTRENLNMLLTR